MSEIKKKKSYRKKKRKQINIMEKDTRYKKIKRI